MIGVLARLKSWGLCKFSLRNKQQKVKTIHAKAFLGAAPLMTKVTSLRRMTNWRAFMKILPSHSHDYSRELGGIFLVIILFEVCKYIISIIYL